MLAFQGGDLLRLVETVEDGAEQFQLVKPESEEEEW